MPHNYDSDFLDAADNPDCIPFWLIDILLDSENYDNNLYITDFYKGDGVTFNGNNYRLSAELYEVRGFYEDNNGNVGNLELDWKVVSESTRDLFLSGNLEGSLVRVHTGFWDTIKDSEVAIEQNIETYYMSEARFGQPAGPTEPLDVTIECHNILDSILDYRNVATNSPESLRLESDSETSYDLIAYLSGREPQIVGQD